MANLDRVSTAPQVVDIRSQPTGSCTRRRIIGGDKLGDNTEALRELTGTVGEVVGAMREMHQRLAEMAQGQRDQAAATEHVAQEVSDLRTEQAEFRGQVTTRLENGDRRFARIEQDLRELRERHKPPDSNNQPGQWFLDLVSWARLNWKWLVGVGGGLYGVIYEAWHRWPHK